MANPRKRKLGKYILGASFGTQSLCADTNPTTYNDLMSASLYGYSGQLVRFAQGESVLFADAQNYNSTLENGETTDIGAAVAHHHMVDGVTGSVVRGIIYSKNGMDGPYFPKYGTSGSTTFEVSSSVVLAAAGLANVNLFIYGTIPTGDSIDIFTSSAGVLQTGSASGSYSGSLVSGTSAIQWEATSSALPIQIVYNELAADSCTDVAGFTVYWTGSA
jgi:hypothetical protein